jgi:hypothetical protein
MRTEVLGMAGAVAGLCLARVFSRRRKPPSWARSTMTNSQAFARLRAAIDAAYAGDASSPSLEPGQSSETARDE